MSDGLKLLSAIISTSSASTLLSLDPATLIDRESEAYEFVRGFYRTYRELPQAGTVREETGINLPGVNQSLQYYVDNVSDRFIYNRIHDQYGTLREQMTQRDIPGMTETVNAMQRATRHTTNNSRCVNLGEAMTLVAERLESTRGMGGMTGVTSGLPRFDEITGGFQNSDLISLIARPGIGKTYELLKMAMAAYADGMSVLFVTTEMGIEQIGRRYVSLELGINPTLLKMNMVDTHMERRIRSLYREMVNADRFKIFSVGMRAKVSAIEAYMQEFGPDIVYVDGTYLLHPSIAGNFKRIERVGEVFDELKGLTIDSGVPIVNTMQFNREAGKNGKEGSLENIGFSDAVGMHSSIVVAMKYGPTLDPRVSRELEFLKGREGEIGKIIKHFRFAPVNFAEYTHEEEAALAGGEAAEAADVGWMAGPRTAPVVVNNDDEED